MRRPLLVAALVVATVACSPPPAEVDRGYLVITGAGGSLETVDMTTEERQVVSPASGAPVPVQATASHDGTTLVWSDVDAEGRQVIRVRAEGATNELEVPTVPFYYAFNADGSTLAALGNDPAGQGVALLLIDLDGDRAELVEVGQPYFIDWGPDGERLAVHVGNDVLGLVDGRGDRTNVEVSPGLFSAPAWTEDGRIVAVLATDQLTASLAALQAPRFTLALVDPDDASTETVADLSESAAFEISGDRIAYIHADSGLGPLAVVDVDGRNPVEVAADEVVAFEWSPDGQSLLFYTLAGESLELVPHVWDGDAVVDFAGFMPTAMFVNQYLPFWAQYTRTITQWSPDSTGFAYAAAPDDGPGQIRFQPLDGEIVDMGEGEMVIWSP